ncbi:MAG: DEAD/DEAH box helicase [Bacteroidetes bacterium]|nr:DEAD/DEAH box helicase [Bacteroidota bacterium]
MTFDEFGFEPDLREGIRALGFETATPIQEQAIPVIFQGKDLIGTAQTGTGKTAAFLLPLIQKIMTGESKGNVRALVIVPTRELAVQIDQHMEGLSYFTPVSSIAIYGGTEGMVFTREKQALTEGADLVICTPGRMTAHVNMGYVDFSNVECLILDEADRMLDMGFYDDIMKLVNLLPKERQTLMFSATMPKAIRQMAQKILKDPVEINIAMSKPAEKILQLAYSVYDNQKLPLTQYLLHGAKGRTVLVFCSTKSSTKVLNRALHQMGLNVSEIHSDLEQREREEVLNSFRNKTLNVLVATDIVSRGIDVENIDMVVNYDVPHDAEDYIHRIGRTARAAASGIAVTFISPKEQRKFQAIENLLGKSVHKGEVPLQFGPAPEYRAWKPRN